MPAEATITPELIIEVANELAANGAKVTHETVRAALLARTGVGGSHSTTGPVLAKWRKDREAAEQRVADVQVSVPQALLILRERNQREEWAVAVRESDARFDGEREAHKAEVARLATEVAEALRLADGLQAELDAMGAELALESARAAAGEEQIDQLRRASAVMSERAQVAEARNEELHARLDDQGRELEALRAQVAKLTEERGQAEESLTEGRIAIERLRGDVGRLETALQETKDRAVGQALAAEEAQRLLAVERTNGERLQSELAQLREAVRQQDTAVSAAKEEALASKYAMSEAERLLSSERATLASVKDELRQAGAQALAAKEEAAELRGEVRALQAQVDLGSRKETK